DYPVYIIHLQKDMLDRGDRELAAATLVHELSHNLYEPTLEGAMRTFHLELAELLADHPRIAARRGAATNAAAARAQHVVPRARPRHGRGRTACCRPTGRSVPTRRRETGRRGLIGGRSVAVAPRAKAGLR
ncbi:MAG: hypothetical protein ABW221_21300, partial [Vicinamibacteria bacterium]